MPLVIRSNGTYIYISESAREFPNGSNLHGTFVSIFFFFTNINFRALAICFPCAFQDPSCAQSLIFLAAKKMGERVSVWTAYTYVCMYTFPFTQPPQLLFFTISTRNNSCLREGAHARSFALRDRPSGFHPSSQIERAENSSVEMHAARSLFYTPKFRRKKHT